VSIEATEWSPSGAPYKWSMTFELASQPIAIGSRHANEFFVLTHEAPHPVALEVWTMHAPQGAYYTECPPSSRPIGTPSELASTMLKVNGPYVRPDQRSRPNISRSVIASPSDWKDAQLIAADPEGRFVLSVTTDEADFAQLNQLDLKTGSIAVLADSASIPHLADARELMFLDSDNVGRLLTIPTDGLHTYCLVDEENDGVFETIDSLTELEYSEKYPAHSVTKQP